MLGDPPKVIRLACHPSCNPWGKVGVQGLVAQLLGNACSEDPTLDLSQSHCEIWMGTHPASPAKIYDSGLLLSRFLGSYPQFQGDCLGTGRFPLASTETLATDAVRSVDLPFLLKILSRRRTDGSPSIRSSSSPAQLDDSIADSLLVLRENELEDVPHRIDSNNFGVTTNHIPGIAICISPRFIGFVGFRPWLQIRALLLATLKVPQLPQKVHDVILRILAIRPQFESDDEHLDASRANECIQKSFGAFLLLEDEDRVAAVDAVAEIVGRCGVEALSDVGTGLASEDKKALVEDVVRLRRCLPGGRRGLHSIFFMHLVELEQGEGLYIGAGGAYAWLEGDIVELARSNVLSCGSTPVNDPIFFPSIPVPRKYDPRKDKPLFLKGREFEKARLAKSMIYSVPFEQLFLCHVVSPEAIDPLTGPALGIITEGTMTLWDRDRRGHHSPLTDEAGTVFLIAAGTELGIKGDGKLWFAFCDSDTESIHQTVP